MVCGTYQLEESEEGGRAEQQTRRGRLLVVKVQDDVAGGLGLKQQSALDVPGVFDIKWGGWGLGGDRAPLLGHAAADGQLYVYRISTEGLSLAQSVDCRKDDAPPGTLALSLDWSDRRRGAREGSGGGASRQVAVSMSDGTMCIVESAEGGTLHARERWKAHDLEAWIATWDCHSPEGRVLYSGADDGILKVWDLRVGTGAPMSVCRVFDAGVTCMQSHAQQVVCNNPASSF